VVVCAGTESCWVLTVLGADYWLFLLGGSQCSELGSVVPSGQGIFGSPTEAGADNYVSDLNDLVRCALVFST